MSIPVIIVSTVASIFLISLIAFLVFSKKQEKKELEKNLRELEKLDINAKITADAARTPPIKEDRQEPEMPVFGDEFEEDLDQSEEQDSDLSSDDTPDDVSEDDEDVLELGDQDVEEERTVVDIEDQDQIDPETMDYGNIFADDEPVGKIKAVEAVQDDEDDEIYIIKDNSDLEYEHASDSMPEFYHGSSAEYEMEPGAEETTPGVDRVVTPALDEPSPEDIFGASDSDEMDISAGFSDELEDGQEGDEVESLSEEDIENILDTVRPLKTEPSEDSIAPAPEPVEMDEEDQKRHEKARRISRVIINDIRNYNPEKLAEGIKDGNILKTLGVEIERGRQLYIKRVPADIARNTNYYREALIKILADGRADLFGWKQ